ncbi:MAG: RDD family protein [Cellvibrionaceae bacterium]|nr:RDD family protein [Cellvibrionaceae bacterium]
MSNPSLLRRIAAIGYDSLLIMAVSMAYGLLYIGLAKLFGGLDSDRPAGLGFQLGWLLTLVGFYCYFWMRGGQTTGMRAWRIQLVHRNGGSPQLIQCVIRLITALFGWTFFITALFDKHQQCLHDKWSKTRLVLIPKHQK